MVSDFLLERFGPKASGSLYFSLQLRIGLTDLFMGVPRNDAIFPKLHIVPTDFIFCYTSTYNISTSLSPIVTREIFFLCSVPDVP